MRGIEPPSKAWEASTLPLSYTREILHKIGWKRHIGKSACWDMLGASPGYMMCATSRMVVKPEGTEASHVMACTLIAHEEGFDMGPTLLGSLKEVSLNHPNCARFCVLGGGSCRR